MNFGLVWRKWIRGCLCSATANVLVNGSPSGEFRLERGIRQGDPLSPFLFLIVAQGLHYLIQRSMDRGFLEPAQIGDEGIFISHLQYADDTIFVSTAKEENVWAFKCLLKLFELFSGLAVNFDKSSLIGVGVDEIHIQTMASTLNCKVGYLPFKYLGINVGSKLSSTVNWEYLVQKVRKKIRGWSNLKLSFGGRITLVKSVLTSIPIYQLSFSIIPKTTIKEINFLLGNFLWGGGMSSRKIAWIRWDELCHSLRDGGLGLKDLECFNIALMGKWVWRFLTDKESLWARVVRARSGDIRVENGEVKWARAYSVRSSWWKKVVGTYAGRGGRWLGENLSVKIGDGAEVGFWDQNWAGQIILKDVFPRLYRISEN